MLIGEHDTSDTEVEIRDVSTIRNHPKFNNENADFDYSILTLTSPITFSSTIAAVCLPASTQSLYTGQVATVTGWGLTSSGGSPASTLQEAEVEVISNQACSDHYPGKIERYQYYCQHCPARCVAIMRGSVPVRNQRTIQVDIDVSSY